MPTDLIQERLEVFGTLVPSDLEQAVTGYQIHAAQDNTMGIPAAQQDLCRNPAQ
jgi:hypothetical protein